MQQRQPRLGDIVDDYCPRERRLSNHAVVAMVGSAIKQTRCTTCDAEHEYKQAKVPPGRRRKEAGPALYKQVLAAAQPEALKAADSEPVPEEPVMEQGAAAMEPVMPAEPEPPEVMTPEEPDAGTDAGAEDGPVHRRLIRATLPRPEGQATQRPLPQFTVRPPTKFGNGTARGGGGRGPGGGSAGRARPSNARGGFGRVGARPEGFQGRGGPAPHAQPRVHHRGGRPVRHGKKSPR